MISIDTNILFFARMEDAPQHQKAQGFLSELNSSHDVVICELILVELYGLLRNPAVIEEPLGAAEAVEECMIFRKHPRWRLAENAEVMASVWEKASQKGFARRRIFDVRSALTLRAHGVTDFATTNVKDFDGLGFEKVWNPLI